MGDNEALAAAVTPVVVDSQTMIVSESTDNPSKISTSLESESSRIKLLPQTTINRIAAGEVIQRPMNAVKEMVENSIDAEATQITVTIGNGGLKLIQVQDDGSGIDRSDLKLLCTRHATSKLQQFDQLTQVSTYGFRGEALASLSYCAHVSVVTKRADCPVAYRAEYAEGTLKPSYPRPIAGNQGTIVSVSDLFYNTSIRLSALRIPNEEHAKIVDLLSRYAIENPSVGFTLKRQGDSSVDLKTPPQSTSNANIGILFGNKLAQEIIPINIHDDGLGFKVAGFISPPHFSSRRFTFILFINGRLVECPHLKRAVDQTFAIYISKTNHPFVYMSLQIPPAQIDVNIHPTKQQVAFMNESEIFERITTALDVKLSVCNESRPYSTNVPLGGSPVIVSTATGNTSKTPEMTRTTDTTSKHPSGGRTSGRPLYDHQLVRTDSRERKLNQFFSPSTRCNSPLAKRAKVGVDFEPDVPTGELKTAENDGVSATETSKKPSSVNSVLTESSSRIASAVDTPLATAVNPQKEETRDEKRDVGNQNRWRDLRLHSVHKLRTNLGQRCSPLLRDVVKQMTYVGCIDPSRMIIQYKTGLYLVDLQKLTEELFYQTILFRFGNLSCLSLTTGGDDECAPSVEQLTAAGLTHRGDRNNFDEKLQYTCEIFETKSQLLWDYFSIRVQDGRLKSIPNVLPGYSPQLEGLPEFVVDFVASVDDWSDEQPCLDTVARCIARFYSLKRRYCNGTAMSAIGQTETSLHWVQIVETVVCPALKRRLLPPKEFATGGTVTSLADLHELYKVFERC